jgi:hypothetical protein
MHANIAVKPYKQTAGGPSTVESKKVGRMSIFRTINTTFLQGVVTAPDRLGSSETMQVRDARITHRRLESQIQNRMSKSSENLISGARVYVLEIFIRVLPQFSLVWSYSGSKLLRRPGLRKRV